MIEALIGVGVVICFILIGSSYDENEADDTAQQYEMKSTKEELEQRRKELER